MYYCDKCGVVRFVNRPRGDESLDNPSGVLNCPVCDEETRHRLVLPEYLNATNDAEFKDKIRDIKDILGETVDDND